jgi:hypothetical protein
MQTVENIYHYWLEYSIYQYHRENIFNVTQHVSTMSGHHRVWKHEP